MIEKSNDYAILIPARYESTRFPGKPLVELDGIPMVKRVYNTCISTGFDTYVLTDDQRVVDTIGENAVMTDHYENGTARCAGALKKLPKKYKYYINVQGDMPDITPEIIVAVAKELYFYSLITCYTDMNKQLQLNPNVVKMIKSQAYALWFGRGFTYGYHHLGIYGYRRGWLELYPKLQQCEEENIERLEQLRWLIHDHPIRAIKVDFNGIEINEPNDVERWHESR